MPKRTRSASETISILAPIGGVIAGEGIDLMSAEWDFRDLAALIPGADPAATSKKLNVIYAECAHLDLLENRMSKDQVRRSLKRVSGAIRDLDQAGIEALGKAFRFRLTTDHSQPDIALSDWSLGFIIIQAALTAPVYIKGKPRGPHRKMGARAYAALNSLVSLYCQTTGCARPRRDYQAEDGAEVYHPESLTFARAVLISWNLLDASFGGDRDLVGFIT